MVSVLQARQGLVFLLGLALGLALVLLRVLALPLALA
ncbi:unnamed protein product, partial [marine sediment metagenome]